MTPLHWLADRGPWVLVAGIVAGLSLPGLAQVLVPFIPHMVAGLLFLAALRIGPTRMRAALGDIRPTILTLLLSQLAFPLAVIATLTGLGWISSPFALALVIVAMAPPISGSPNMVLMMGFDPAVTMRYLITGTVLLPLTAIPVLYFLPALGGFGLVIIAALRLLAVIVGAGGLAFAIRGVLPDPSRAALKAIDGASALLMAVIVIGLMSAVNAALLGTPGLLALWMAFVFAVNFGLQIIAFVLTRRPPDTHVSLTVIAGNRNIALFLVALPAEVTGPLLVFIGCYQVPMYLTPILTGRALKAAGLTSQGDPP